MPAFGVYPIADAQTATEQVSSTYEGRHITVLDSEITGHADPDADTFINKGLPLMVGDKIVGIPFIDAAAATDRISVDTEGIWIVDVLADNDAGGSAVAGGDELYINLTTGVVSKINNTAVNRPFGYALGIIAQGLTETIAVKVHFDPSLDTQDRMYKTVTSGQYNYGKWWTGILEAGRSNGVACYFDAQIDGIQTQGIYGGGIWVEPQDTFDGTGGTYLLVAWDEGMYAGGAGEDITSNWVVCQNMAIDLGANPARLDWFRVNAAASSGTAHCVIAAANPNSVGFLADAVDNAGANKLGNVPLFDIVGYGVCYVEVFSA